MDEVEYEFPKTERLILLHHEILSLYPHASLGGDDDFEDGLFWLEVCTDQHRFTLSSERRGYGMSYDHEDEIPEFDMNTVQQQYFPDFDTAKRNDMELIEEHTGS